MEYREAPRVASSDGPLDGVLDEPGPGPRPRLRARPFEFVRPERRLDATRLLAALLLALAALGLLTYLVTETVRRAVQWVHQQAPYQLPFTEIRLVPEPPRWFRGGAGSFLKQVRENAGEPETVSVLALEKAPALDDSRIARAFRLFPWVDDVLRIEYPPRGITVHLAYKTPVATIPYPAGEPVILDRNAHLLPSQDLDPERLPALIPIKGIGLTPPSPANRPGTAWKSGQSPPEAQRIERGVQHAARLAGFLQDHQPAANRGVSKPLRFRAIVATDPRGLWLQDVDGAMILWGEPPGDEPAGTPAAEEKREILEVWAKDRTRKPLPPGDYWAFAHSELKPVATAPPH